MKKRVYELKHPGLQHLVRPEQRTIFTRQFVRPKHRTYTFSFVFPEGIQSRKVEIFKTISESQCVFAKLYKVVSEMESQSKRQNFCCGYWVWTGFCNGRFGISMCGFGGRTLFWHKSNPSSLRPRQGFCKILYNPHFALPLAFDLFRVRAHYAEISINLSRNSYLEGLKTLQQMKFEQWKNGETPLDRICLFEKRLKQNPIQHKW